MASNSWQPDSFEGERRRKAHRLGSPRSRIHRTAHSDGQHQACDAGHDHVGSDHIPTLSVLLGQRRQIVKPRMTSTAAPALASGSLMS